MERAEVGWRGEKEDGPEAMRRKKKRPGKR